MIPSASPWISPFAMLGAVAVGIAAIAAAPTVSAWATLSFLMAGVLIGAAGWIGTRGLLQGTTGALLFIIAGAVGLSIAWSRDAYRFAVADVGAGLTQSAYREYAEDSDLLLDTAESDYRQFMVDRHYTRATRPEDVTEEEIGEFWTGTVPTLIEMQQTRPTYQQWRERQLEVVAEHHKLDQSRRDYILDRLSGLSLISALLGLAIAASPIVGRSLPAPKANQTPPSPSENAP